ncbi:epoxide hydrolase [Paenibacillus sp. GSMTC-2017]|uniref:epoxide hydrolase family protein n=1 Tax=Paenibacillus sp. GSMTC-2017 TaxID=2794350 RepID=UPI0018D6E565|nr:epoxide hydrolase family protein [Paenibacillus sp. GSMTC-2017]MBH5319567.1 epoxide hydrolase [Paenibacillus sp. GSMTC-2017]
MTSPNSKLPTLDTDIQPFNIDIPQVDLNYLKERLIRTRWTDEIVDAGWDYGTNLTFLRKLVNYWAHEFDWRAEEARLNSFPQYTTTIEGELIHFVHVRGEGSNPIPLLLANGWPSNFVELLPLIPLLTRELDGISFDIVIPSLPGFGFSGKPSERGMNMSRTADLWAHLMTKLGYETFMISGSDMGAGVELGLVRNYADRIIGAHWINVYSGFERPQEPTEEEKAYFAKVDYLNFTEGAYAMLQGTKPTSLAVGLNDSPAGLAAWIVEKYHFWGDTQGNVESIFPLDTLCSILTIYWVTETIGSSVRLYKEAFADNELLSPVPKHHVPQGVLLPGPADVPAPRAWGDLHIQNIIRWTELDKGGHFPALEYPEVTATDIRGFYHDIKL